MAPKKDTKKEEKKKEAPKAPMNPELKALLEKEKALPKVPQPDRKDFDAFVEKVGEEITKLQEKQKGIQEQIAARSTGGEAFKKDRDEIRAKLDEYQEQIDTLRGTKDKLHGDIKANKDDAKSKGNELKEMKKKLGFDDLAGVDQEIKRIEQAMHYSSITIKEEKEYLKKISVLKKLKPQLAKISGQSVSVDEGAITDAKAGISDVKTQLDSLFEAKKIQSEALKKLQETRKKQTEGNQDFYDAKEAVNVQIREKIAKRNAQRDEFNKLNKEYNDSEWAKRQLRNDRGRIERDIRQAEWAQRQAEEKDEAGPAAAPFTTELVELDNTIKYLKTLLPQEVVTKEEVTVEEAAGILVQKKDRDDEFFFAPTKGPRSAKGKKGGKKAAPAAPKAKAIVHTMESLIIFDKYKVSPPANSTAVPDCLEALAKQVVNYTKKQAEKVAELERKAALSSEDKKAEEEAAAPAAEEVAA